MNIYSLKLNLEICQYTIKIEKVIKINSLAANSFEVYLDRYVAMNSEQWHVG